METVSIPFYHRAVLALAALCCLTRAFSPATKVQCNFQGHAQQQLHFTPAEVRGVTSALHMADDTDTATSTRATLTGETIWKLRFVLRGLPTTKGRRVDEIFNIYAKFIEEEGYEPPQGTLEQVSISPTTGDEGSDDVPEQSLFQIKESRWQLSEDPNDR